MEQFFANLFGDHVILATILIAMLPIVELRGAIPFGMSIDFWGSNALNAVDSFLVSFLGSSLVVPIIALVFIPILNWLKKTKLFKNLAHKIENRIKTKSEKIENDAEDSKKAKSKFWLKVIGLFAFVAIPLPLTGVYTGTCVGVVLGFSFWQVCAIVIAGNLVAGLIMTFICSIFPAFTSIILYVFLGLVVVFAVYGLIKSLINKRKQKNAPIGVSQENREKASNAELVKTEEKTDDVKLNKLRVEVIEPKNITLDSVKPINADENKLDDNKNENK
mgnify:CR=1 FL=1